MSVDPITLIVGALASGAASGLRKTMTAAITDAYAGLKRLITDKYGVNTDALEKKPESAAQQGALEESLGDAGAAADAELLQAAKSLLAAIQATDPDAAKTIGVDLAGINVADINIEDVKASGGSTGVKARDVNATSMNIKGVEARDEDPDRP